MREGTRGAIRESGGRLNDSGHGAHTLGTAPVGAVGVDFLLEDPGFFERAAVHHDPSHGDDLLDELHAGIRELAASGGPEEVIGAREGLELQL